MDASSLLPMLLMFAVLLPLLSFTVIVLGGTALGKAAGNVATGAILGSAVLSFLSLFVWLGANWPEQAHHGHGDHAASHEDGAHGAHGAGEHGEDDHGDHDTHGNSEHEKDSHDDGHATISFDANDTAVAGVGLATIEGAVAMLAEESGGHVEHAGHAEGEHGEAGGHGHASGAAYTGDWYVLGHFGKLKMSIGYYIDSLTVCMFCMVTLIASCIHFYATGYMHDELHDFTDPEVTMADGSKLTRPGRYPRFFQALSLFCFSMLGLVVAGNIAMTFVFWELVGICSYFLIGFYVERKSASNAANKAFITNRVGDFGMIIGLMALWGALGTFNYGQIGDDAGLFETIRPAANHHEISTPVGMVRMASPERVAEVVKANPGMDHAELEKRIDAAALTWIDEAKTAEETPPGYWLLIIAGVGIFCGCVGKSAQFPLHVWLPDAMEGPTPVSALVHSATMVAAGVFLVARFFPVFVPEVLLVIAICGSITLFMGATIAITATDIKRVLAYSTISQLGYMMLALGVGGWLAGVMHLFTHAFFKSLLFMCSGSVIHAVHTNEMPQMGGLRKKMPYTAYTMLIGCLAIAGAGVPFLVGMSGYYSKDAILEQAFSFRQSNPGWGVFFFLVAAGGAAITAFYMFRLWYMTFAGQPRDADRYSHAHESPKSMYVPLIVVSIFAIGVAWKPFGHGLVSNEAILGAVLTTLIMGLCFFLFGKEKEDAHGHDAHHGHDGHDDHGHHDEVTSGGALKLGLTLAVAALVISVVWSFIPGPGGKRLGDVTLAQLLEQARPAGTAAFQKAALFTGEWPDEHYAHLEENFSSIVAPATIVAFSTAFGGFMLATVMYCWGIVDPNEVKRQFAGVHRFLTNKWWFDELYEYIFIKPTHWVSSIASGFDQRCIDWFLHQAAWLTRSFSVLSERIGDQTIIDGAVNKLASFTYGTGSKLRGAQTGSLRQYIMFIGAGTVAVFALASFFWGAGFGQ